MSPASTSSRARGCRAASSRPRAPTPSSRPTWCFIALGFTGPETPGLLDGLGVELTNRGNIKRDDAYMTTVDGVFVAGDAGRGQSLIVWAIAEGRSAAAGVDAFLMGSSMLPDPVHPTAVALR